MIGMLVVRKICYMCGYELDQLASGSFTILFPIEISSVWCFYIPVSTLDASSTIGRSFDRELVFQPSFKIVIMHLIDVPINSYMRIPVSSFEVTWCIHLVGGKCEMSFKLIFMVDKVYNNVLFWFKL